MRRCAVQSNGHSGENSEFHLDVSQPPMWQNNSMAPPTPMHVQLVPPTFNGHHPGADHLINNSGDQMERRFSRDTISIARMSRRLESAYFQNFLYQPSAQSSAFNGNGTIYFTHASLPLNTGPPSSQGQSLSHAHYHQYNPSRTFDNTNRPQFHHPSHFQSPAVLQHPPPPSPQLPMPFSPTSHLYQQQQEEPMVDLPPRFRRLKTQDLDRNFPQQQRPMSGDFERLENSHNPSWNSFSRLNHEHRFQSRPQSFYDFSTQPPPNNNFVRSSNNTRYQRHNNHGPSLPLSAYMNTDDSSNPNEAHSNNNHYQPQQQQQPHWSTTNARRRSTQPRIYHQDRHQFPLSSYDPRQYGFTNTSQKRTDQDQHTNANRSSTDNPQQQHGSTNDPNDIDLIEEWWEDNNTELIGSNSSTAQTDPGARATIDDSGNSSLSTSMHLKETTLDDEENNVSTNEILSPPSDVSTTDSKKRRCTETSFSSRSSMSLRSYSRVVGPPSTGTDIRRSDG